MEARPSHQCSALRTNPFSWLNSHHSWWPPNVVGWSSLSQRPLQAPRHREGLQAVSQPLGHPGAQGWRETPRQGVADRNYSQPALGYFGNSLNTSRFLWQSKTLQGKEKKVPLSKAPSLDWGKENLRSSFTRLLHWRNSSADSSRAGALLSHTPWPRTWMRRRLLFPAPPSPWMQHRVSQGGYKAAPPSSPADGAAPRGTDKIISDRDTAVSIARDQERENV